MPSLPPILVELRAQSGEFTRKMREAQHDVHKLGESGNHLQKMAAVGKAAFLGLTAGAAVLGVASVEAADHFEMAHARLETAIANTGGSFDELKSRIDASATMMQHFGYTAADTQSALATLTAASHSPTAALNLMGLAADLARGRNISLQDATSLLAKVQTGHVALLGRLGIAVKDASGKTITQQQAIAKLSAMYGGAAKRSAETFAGKQEELKATAVNLATRIGLVLIPVILRLVSVISTVITWLEKHKSVVIAVGGAVGGVLVAAMAAWVVETYQAVVANLALGTSMLPIILVAALVGAAVLLLATHWRVIWNAMRVAAVAVWHALVSAWQSTWNAIRGALAAAWSALRPLFMFIWNVGLLPLRVEVALVRFAFEVAWRAIGAVVRTAWSILRPVFGAVVKAGFWYVRKELEVLTSVWGYLWSGITSVVQGVWSVLKPIFDAIAQGMRVVGGAIGTLSKVGGSVGHAISSLVPHFAEGGYVSKPTLALIGEGGEGEYVVPQSKMGQFSAQSSGGGGGDVHVTVVVDGEVVRRVTQRSDRRYQLRNGRDSWSAQSA